MKNETEENQEEVENGSFGYGASIVFLVFIAFVIYFSIRG